jgi:hypothetical protein
MSDTYPPQFPPPAPIVKRPPGAVPRWVLFLVAVAVLALAIGIGMVFLLGTAFACDSGWSGCGEVGGQSIIAYAIASIVGLIALLLVGVTAPRSSSSGRARRIISLVGLPFVPFLAVIIAVIVYAIGYQAHQG